ncbi:hypothetical protein SAMN05421684_8118 [Asanoa ishikariensis]|uniref:HpcH/HpaI aldolase/citrate lyase family protein n=1 Tax=Asanoa ishikariensis TaxID=137265 RepID=A0A1H3UWH8_9ACTN|nr:hypothetical protein SAMN05421684_8118 [Asanoa ishikariensis]
MSTDRRTPTDQPLIAPLFHRLIDDAAVFPPGNAALPDAVTAHREHRAAWYAELVGPLLVPATSVDALTGLLDPAERLDIGIIGDLPIDRLGVPDDPRVVVRQIEAAVAKRGEDPQPGLARVLDLAARQPEIDVYAEIPLTFGLLAGLDTIATARASGARVAAKFRTGGLAAELFPTPVELAAVICACRERELPFKLTAGLHHALRHADPETGFTHHGFLNVLAGTALALDGGEVADVAELLAAIDAVPLIEPVRARRHQPRGLWVGFGSCSMIEPLTDLIRLGLVNGGYEG